MAVQGRDLLRSGAYAEALERLASALALDPTNAWAFARRSEVYERIDDLVRAMDDINRAISLRSDYAWAFIWRARLHQATHQYAASLEDFERAIAMDAGVFRADHVLPERALLLALDGRYEEAISLYEQAVAADPSNAFALYGRAAVRCLMSRDARAKTAIDEARTVISRELGTETHTRAYYELGGLLALKRDFDRALAILSEVLFLEKHQILRTPAKKRARLDLAWFEVRGTSDFERLIG